MTAKWEPGFWYDGDAFGFDRFYSTSEAIETAKADIGQCRERAIVREHWPDETELISYGICLPLAAATEQSTGEESCDYHLREPEIDAAAFWTTVTEHAPKVAEALAAALHDRLSDKVAELTNAVAAVDYFKAQDPMVKLEAWKRETQEEDRSYTVDSYGRFYVTLIHSDTRVAFCDAETLAEAVNVALEAAKRGGK